MTPKLHLAAALSAAFGRKLKRVLDSDAAYRVAPKWMDTWTSGGCLVLAKALLEVLGPKAKLAALEVAGRVEHVVVDIGGGRFLDGDGMSNESALRMRWIAEEGLTPDVRLVPLDPTHLGDIRAPATDVHRVARYLSVAL